MLFPAVSDINSLTNIAFLIINISDFINEISREVELIMNDQKEVYSNEYKKEILERLINIQSLVFEKENE